MNEDARAAARARRRTERDQAARRRAERRSSGEPPAWLTRTTEIFDAFLALIILTLLWMLLTALGLVVLGIAPATVAVADTLEGRRRDEGPHLLKDTWRTYRREFLRSSARLLPFLVVQVAAGFSADAALRSLSDVGAMGAAMATLAVLAGAWASMSAMTIVASRRVRGQDWAVTMRLALLLPGATAVRSVLALLAVAGWSVLSITLPAVGALLGPSVASRLAIRLLTDPVETLLSRLERDRSAARSSPDGPDPDRSAHRGTL